jgi:hypothetical protein
MGNTVAILVGVALIVVGFIIALFTASMVIEQVKLFEILSAFEGYLIGAIIAMFFMVIGGLLLIAGLKSD